MARGTRKTERVRAPGRSCPYNLCPMSTIEPVPEKKPTPALPPRLREAVYEIHQYLSDRVAPLMVYDSVKVLMRQQPEFLAGQIGGWSAAQVHSGANEVPISDYLFHAAKKLHILGDFKLIPAAALAAYLESLWPHLIALCPEED